MIAVTATPLPAEYAVRVDVTGAAGPVTVTRTHPDGRSEVVRGGEAVPPVSGAVTVTDHEAPFGIVVTYRAADGATTADVNVTLDVGTPVLSHPSLISHAVPVTVESDEPAWEGRSRLHVVVGRADPIATVAPTAWRAGTLTLRLPDVATTDQLLAAWADGWPLLLRVPCDLIRSGWLALVRLGETAPTVDRPPRQVRVEYQQVARPVTGPYTPGPWRWLEVRATHATWTDVQAVYETWADLVADRRVATLP